MKVTKKTPHEALVIEGLDFTCAAPFNEGDTITAGEASALNQTLRENMRNNFAKKVKDAKTEAEKNGAEVDLSALQTELNSYTNDYEFGTGRGGFRTADPVRRKAIELAKEKVKAAFVKKGFKASEITSATLTEKAVEAIDGGKYPQFMEQAKVLVEAEQAAAAATGGDLDLDVPEAA